MTRALVLLSLALISLPAFAREHEGVTLPDQISVEGRSLSLNGMGLRTKFWVSVYVGGLYLEKPTKDAGTVITSDQAKRVEMVFVRDLAKEKMIDSINAGFEANAAAQLPKLRERLDKLIGALADLKKGDRILITYVPGKGTVVKSGSKELTVEGKDFADAIFSVWLGASPADASLKTALLGG